MGQLKSIMKIMLFSCCGGCCWWLLLVVVAAASGGGRALLCQVTIYQFGSRPTRLHLGPVVAQQLWPPDTKTQQQHQMSVWLLIENLLNCERPLVLDDDDDDQNNKSSV